MPRRRHPLDPLTRLVANIRGAARCIHSPAIRRVAARMADEIPVTLLERANGAKAEMAKQARRIMRALPDMPPEAWDEAAIDLTACADALQSHFHVTSEIRLGDRRRPSAA